MSFPGKSANAGNPPAANAAGNPDTITETPETNSADPANAEGGEGSESNRLLQESKQWKQRAQAAERALKDKQEKEAKEQGNYKSLYEQAQKEAESLKKGLMKKTLKASVAEAAQKLGCVDVEGVMLLGNHDLIQFEEVDGEIKVNGIQQFMEEVKSRKGYLFQGAKAPVVNHATPGATSAAAPQKVDAAAFNKLPPAQKAALWKELMADFKAGGRR